MDDKSAPVLYNGLAPHQRQTIIHNNGWLNAIEQTYNAQQAYTINLVPLYSRNHGTLHMKTKV